MEKFLNPQSVALIGVPRKTGAGTFNNAETMLRYAYRGRIYPINPNAQEICGLKSYPDISALPEQVELAVISVGRDRVLPMFQKCIHEGIKRVIIITQGFADADEEGAKLQDEISNLARINNVRVIGPNTMGVLNNYVNFSTSFVDVEVPKSYAPVSLIAQTGVIQVATKNMAWNNWGKAIDIGNGCDVDFIDALSYFADDPETSVIVIHMEGMRRGKDFLELAGFVTPKKPVIVFKTGRSKAGAHAALSHTGSLVGEDEVFDAAFRRAGIIRVRNAAELKDAIHALVLMKEMTGPRLGVLTVTGAGGIMCADACEDHGLQFSELPEGLSDKLRKGLPDWIHVGNPVDIWPIGMIGGHYLDASRTALTELLKSELVDGVISIFPASDSPMHSDLNMTKTVAEARQNANNKKPLAVWPYLDVSSAIGELEAIEGVACFDTIEQAVHGLSFCLNYHRAKNRHLPIQKAFSIDKNTLAPLLEKGRKEKMFLGEEALQLLGAFGIPVVKGMIINSQQQLEEVLPLFSFPLVVKLAGSSFAHKKEWEGVVMGIKSLPDALNAIDTLIDNVRQRDSKVAIEGFHLQEQVYGRELLLGLKKDPHFGHVIACGLGGTYTEVFRDISRELVPINRETAKQMISALKIYPLLAGVRGESGADIEAVMDVMERLSLLATEIPDITELDINPLIVSAHGCFVADARIIW